MGSSGGRPYIGFQRPRELMTLGQADDPGNRKLHRICLGGEAKKIRTPNNRSAMYVWKTHYHHIGRLLTFGLMSPASLYIDADVAN